MSRSTSPTHADKEQGALALTTGEFSVLKVLLEHPRQPLSRDRLMVLARGREQGPLRPRHRRAGIAAAQADRARPGDARYLQTVWGFGYVFIPDGEAR